MLGRRIKELRRRDGMALEKLACASGFSEDELRRIENGEVEQIEAQRLIKIVDALSIKKARDFLLLMKLNRKPPEFKAYCVGLAKTGTTSIAGIFNSYPSQHEYLNGKTGRMFRKYKKGKITKEKFREFVIWRDANAYCAMDSSSLNHLYVDVLAEEFPSAKFIFTIRDCYSWLDSLTNYLLSSTGAFWYNSLKMKGLNSVQMSLVNKNELGSGIYDFIEDAIVCWESVNKRTLKQLHPGRSLIIKTNEISERLKDMSDFIGVPLKTLNRKEAHSGKARNQFNILKKVDEDFLTTMFNKYCSALMEEFFPDYTLKDFLNKET